MTIYLNELKQFAYNKVFVETGTYRGRGVIRAIRAGFSEIYTIEIDPFKARRALERFQKYGVIVLAGDSCENLTYLLPTIGDPITFWLDAHGPGYCSLMEELELIGRHHRNDHTILIDDVRLFESEWKLTEETVIEALLEINPAYNISYVDGAVQNDVMVAAP